MERNGDFRVHDESHPIAQSNEQQNESSVLSSSFFLDHVGEVVLTLDSDGLSWKLPESLSSEDDKSSCLGIPLIPKSESSIKISDVYAVDFINWGLVHESVLSNPRRLLLGHTSQMYRFTVHGIQRSKALPSLWVPIVYTFGHKDLQTCQTWANRINTVVNMEPDRPRSLLVFVHPRSGKGNGSRTWELVFPIFSQAKVKTKVIVTERAGHAFDVMASITNRELNSYDGVVTVGGDGFFGEVLNGLLLSRHNAPYPPNPPDYDNKVETNRTTLVDDENITDAEHSSDIESPLLIGSTLDRSQMTSLRMKDNPCDRDQDSEFSFPNEKFRFGLIPAGSTDAIVICTTGTRDPITSALNIILGKRVRLDIAQVVRWQSSPTSKDEPRVRYAASFAGYGFYGDVITESEKYRWMGPKRYDYAGTKVFLKHRSYEAEVAYLKDESEKTSTSPRGHCGGRLKSFWCHSKESERLPCRSKCDICSTKTTHSQEPRWLRSKGRFLSIGAAVISCRNEKAPDGLVADAHLSDGFLHLILIRDCPRAFYLWHLTQLTRKGGRPLNFDFVEHHKTRAFTFTSFGKQSVWNVDGEILKAHKLSAQVFRGLISLFATGPES